MGALVGRKIRKDKDEEAFNIKKREEEKPEELFRFRR